MVLFVLSSPIIRGTRILKLCYGPKHRCCATGLTDNFPFQQKGLCDFKIFFFSKSFCPSDLGKWSRNPETPFTKAV